jgi:hypothetical protein
MTIKKRFLDAVIKGELGSVEDVGIIVTLHEFKMYFKDINTQYSNSFLPAAVIENGQRSITHTKFLFRLRKGVYLVHPDAIESHIVIPQVGGGEVNEPELSYMV